MTALVKGEQQEQVQQRVAEGWVPYMVLLLLRKAGMWEGGIMPASMGKAEVGVMVWLCIGSRC